MMWPSSAGPVAPSPLDGVLVADFSRVLAGPLATMTLADLGATVIKVERPGIGDDTRRWGPPWSRDSSTYFDCVNRGKQSIALDLSDPGDLADARRIAERADVVIENFRPGTMDRLGLGYRTLAALHQQLVYCSITGFGGEGAGADLPGYDFVVQAVGGLMSITGFPDGEPTKAGVALVDVITGKDAVVGILAALHGRDRTGHGDRIEVSLLSSLLGALANQGQAALHTGRDPEPLGNRHPSIAPYETFHCRDATIAVACGNDAQFARLTRTLGVPELAADPRFTDNAGRVAHREPLAVELQRPLLTRDAAHWVQQLTTAGVPAGRVNSVTQAVEFAERLGLQPTVDVGAARQIRHPVRWQHFRTASPTPPPRLGEHTATVRGWLADEHSTTDRRSTTDLHRENPR